MMIFHRCFLPPLRFYSFNIFFGLHLYTSQYPYNLMLNVLKQGREHFK